jgi:MoaA/NifB/PqqE/SkfB family radical SAM enzyme
MNAPVDVTPPRSPTNGDIHFNIDVIDKCNLRCPTCFRGTGAQKNAHGSMPLDRFRVIVNKAFAEGYPNISLINWTEALLLKSLDQYVRIVKEFPVDCWISSNLSLPPARYLPSITATLAAGVDFLFVSISGFSQATYEINHKKGRVDWIKENLAGIARALHSGEVKTSVWIRYLEWAYNAHEKRPWEELAAEYGIGFHAVPAHGDPLQPLPGAKEYSEHVKRCVAHAQQAEPVSRIIEVPDKVCGLIMDRVAIDAKGDAYLCGAYPNMPELKIGAYADMTEHELLIRRHRHRFCTVCLIPPRDATKRDRDRFDQALATQR